ncbi:MAG TPA: VWA domain-containing protein, partial [Pirellulales bacterium]|nr:VWA domain-containing protein [Pirellulales bacterium]
RNILLVDNSASMGAIDIAPNRLEEAKRRALELVDALDDNDTAMVISFAESAQIVQSFTNNRHQLRRAIESIRLTDAGTNLEEALRMAGGLSNVARSGASQGAPAEAPPARLFILSDGDVPDVDDVELGNLEAEFIPIGTTDAANVAIIALGLDEANSQRATRQIFARLQNFGSRETTATVSLQLDGQLIDAATVDLPAHEASGIAFELDNIETGVLELHAECPAEFDQLAIDNRAWAPINPPRRSRILLVTAGDEPLRAALGTARAMEIADVETLHPAELAEESYKTKAASRAFDLIVFDLCQPSEMPQANTLFLGVVPPVGWQADAEVSVPQVIDVEVAHPMMHLVELSDVLIAAARPLKPPRGARVLVESNLGPLLAIAPRDEFEDAVLAFAIAGAAKPETNWPLRLSFPVFVLNTLQYFGPRGEALASGGATSGIVSPGSTVTLPIENASKTLRVRDPDGTMRDVPRDRRNALTFVAAKAGVYEIVEGDRVVSRVAADVLNPRESNSARRADDSIRIGHANIKGDTTWESVRSESWKALVVAALAILLIEWYIFNRRVFI